MLQDLLRALCQALRFAFATPLHALHLQIILPELYYLSMSWYDSITSAACTGLPTCSDQVHGADPQNVAFGRPCALHTLWYGLLIAVHHPRCQLKRLADQRGLLFAMCIMGSLRLINQLLLFVSACCCMFVPCAYKPNTAWPSQVMSYKEPGLTLD